MLYFAGEHDIARDILDCSLDLLQGTDAGLLATFHNKLSLLNYKL